MPDENDHIIALEAWIKTRKKDLNYAYEQFDKLIILISSGGLVLTIGFVRDIVEINADTNTGLLKGSWYLLTAALIINLLGQIMSLIANNLEIKITNAEIVLLKEGKEPSESGCVNWIRKVFFRISNFSVKISNILSFLLLVTGIVVFIIFVNQNL